MKPRLSPHPLIVKISDTVAQVIALTPEAPASHRAGLLDADPVIRQSLPGVACSGGHRPGFHSHPKPGQTGGQEKVKHPADPG